MAEVNFKVSLLDDNLEKSEVRRFVAEPNLTIFKEKLKTLFGNHDNFQISWQDEDGDQVLVDSDDELKIALEEMSGKLPFSAPEFRVFSLFYSSGGLFWSFGVFWSLFKSLFSHF